MPDVEAAVTVQGTILVPLEVVLVNKIDLTDMATVVAFHPFKVLLHVRE